VLSFPVYDREKEWTALRSFRTSAENDFDPFRGSSQHAGRKGKNFRHSSDGLVYKLEGCGVGNIPMLEAYTFPHILLLFLLYSNRLKPEKV
jgi:hypothetical protein